MAVVRDWLIGVCVGGDGMIYQICILVVIIIVAVPKVPT